MSSNKNTRRDFFSLFSQGSDEPSIASPLWKLTAPKPQRKAAAPPCAIQFDEACIFWTMRNLPAQEATKHLLVCGMTGGGKSIAIQLFLQSIAPRFRVGAPRPEQLILFDGKCDAVSMLASLGIRPEHPNVWILNPYDERSAVWDLGEAMQEPVMGRAFATLLVPEEKNSSAPFFSDSARELIFATTLGLNKVAGIYWSFRDLLCALDSRRHLFGVTANSERARLVTEGILNDSKHSDAVLATLATKVGRYEQVAALWHSNPKARKFSIKKFLSEPGVLVLGNDPVLRDSFWPINSIMLKAIANEVLRQPNTFQPRCWFVLDEFRAMERVDCIHDLINRGRSKGVSVTLGILGVEGLMDLYGEHNANDILSQCATKMFLRAGGPKTAEWAANYFNKVRQHEDIVTETTGREGDSKSIQHTVHDRPLFLPSYFLNLPLPGRDKPYKVVCDVPFLNSVIIVERETNQLLSWCRQPDEKDVPSLKPRNNPAHQIVKPWAVEEERRFCVPPSDDSDGGTRAKPAGTPPTKPVLPPRFDPGEA
jgi:type IV secretory pathway TraG/TraD family ATPase VirD4